jgi:hypothetical protein
MHLFTNELAGLRARGLSFSLCSFGSLHSLFFWHELPPCHVQRTSSVDGQANLAHNPLLVSECWKVQAPYQRFSRRFLSKMFAAIEARRGGRKKEAQDS